MPRPSKGAITRALAILHEDVNAQTLLGAEYVYQIIPARKRN